VFDRFKNIWSWLRRHKVVATWLGAIGGLLSGVAAFGTALLSGVAAFGTWIETHHLKNSLPDRPAITNPQRSTPPPLAYDPFTTLTFDQKSKQTSSEMLTRLRNLSQNLAWYTPGPPTWKRTTIYDFAYAVDYYDQGDGRKQTFFVNCVGRLHLDICGNKDAKYRKKNHIHYDEWSQLPN
jgi:hypothetical protein